MDLKGKIINFLGDSITEGHVAQGLRGFPVLLQERCKLKEMRNYGRADTRIARQHTPSPYANWDYDFCQRALDMDPGADVVVVFGGTNDFGTGDAPLGSFEDRTPDTFYGACHTLYSTLLTRYPQAVIVVVTPLPRAVEQNEEQGKTLLQYVQIIRQVACFYRLPILDLYDSSGLQPALPSVQQAYMPDGLHPNDAGHALLANWIEEFLTAL